MILYQTSSRRRGSLLQRYASGLGERMMRHGASVALVEAKRDAESAAAVARDAMLTAEAANSALNRLVSAIKESKDGDPISVGWSSSDEIGVVIKEFENLQDRQFRAQSQLQDSEIRFRDFAAASSDWFWEMDEDLRFTYFSKRFAEITGIPPDALLGKSRRDRDTGISDVEEEAWRLHLADLAAHRPFREFRHSREHPERGTVYLSISGKPVFDEAGKFRGYRGTGTDVTEPKQAEESRAKLEQQLVQSQKMDAIGQLTGGIAHDFNNLLMVIGGFSQRAIRSIDDAQVAKKCLERVISASDKATNLIRQLLVFSRRKVMETRVVSAARVLEETMELLQRSLGEQIELALEISDDAISVKTDAGQLSTAVMNLVINARDAMPQGGTIVVGMRTTESDEDFAARHPGLEAGPYAEIYVRDQGPGIDPAILEHIFEPFFTTKEPGKGTGLGLAMVYGFAQQSGGIVDVSSSPGAGSTFRIYLPLTDRAPEAEVFQVETAHRGKGEVILVVEDDEALLDLASIMLEELGYTVLPAEDGLAAIEVEENYEERIDLLLCDVVMPNLGGFEVATILGESSPEMKVVFMSGYPGRENLQNLEIPDDAVFLQKPVKPEVLAKTIREVLDTDDLRLAS